MANIIAQRISRRSVRLFVRVRSGHAYRAAFPNVRLPGFSVLASLRRERPLHHWPSRITPPTIATFQRLRHGLCQLILDFSVVESIARERSRTPLKDIGQSVFSFF